MSPWLSDLLLRSQSDERLVSLARAGHDRAFATIVERYRPELLAFARRLGSDGRAEDVLQQAFLSAFVSLRSGTEVSHVRGWLYQIVRNAATKMRPGRDLPLDDVLVAAESLEDVVQRRAMAMSAVSELARLPERQRDALVAVALNGQPGADVAVTMGLSEGALRQLVHRARTSLRGAVTAVTPWPLARWLATMGPASGPDVAAATGVVSAGGVAAKLGAVLATGVFATTIAVLPPDSHGPTPAARHHVAGARQPGRDLALLAATSSSGGPATVASPPSRAVDASEHRFSGQQAHRGAKSPGHAARRHRDDRERTGVAGGDGQLRMDGGAGSGVRSSGGNDTTGGPGEHPSTNAGSGRHDDGGASDAGGSTRSGEHGSGSGGDAIREAATTGAGGRTGGSAGSSLAHDGSTDTNAAPADTSGSGSGSGQDAGGGGGPSESASGGGGGADSGSSSDSSDTQSAADH